MESFHVALPSVPRVPILLSVPHCGTDFPEEVRDSYDPELIKAPDDTDWFVDRLYSFAPAMGITMISAVWSRWVIDLNRDPDGMPLYADGRIITPLCPVTTFLREPLYKDKRREVEPAEVQRRRRLYFEPYHARLRELLNDMLSTFGKVLLWDCHSIRQEVPTIQQEKFPDLILGSADGNSAGPALVDAALGQLRSRSYNVFHNDPFKGGYITRHYGKPAIDQHALQLEMTKINYMDDAETDYDPERAEKMEELLNNTLSALSERLISVRN